MKFINHLSQIIWFHRLTFCYANRFIDMHKILIERIKV